MIITKGALRAGPCFAASEPPLMLPLLDAMIPPLTAMAATPADPARLRRLGFVFMPMGCDNYAVDAARRTEPRPALTLADATGEGQRTRHG